MLLNDRILVEMVHGGAVLGGGGGGSISTGLAAGRMALADRELTMVAVSDLPDDAILATLSVVGTIGESGVDNLDPAHQLRTLELFMRSYDFEIAGFIPSEVGGGAVTYGWRESSATGIPLVDAPCNGRAHPTSVMGSLGLHRSPGYLTSSVIVGGDQEEGTYLELTATGSVTHVSQIVRNAAAKISNPVAVIRNPVSVGYVRQHAAVGALSLARHIGETLLAQIAHGLPAVLDSLSAAMSGRVLAIGRINMVELSDREGFTVGTIGIDDEASGSRLQIVLCNEYLLAIRDGSPVSAFPDLIVLIDETTCLPLNPTDVRPGQRTGVLTVPQQYLKLASTMKEQDLLRPVERLLKSSFPELDGAIRFDGAVDQ